jgi:hypothetical protein
MTHTGTYDDVPWNVVDPDRPDMSADEIAAEDNATTWEPLNIADLVAQLAAGEIARTVPLILMRDDGNALFYAGKVNGIHGDSGSGKTWTALYAAAQVLARGGVVVYVDLEDSPADLLARLLALGVAPNEIAERFRYVQPDQAFEAGADGFLAMIDRDRPELVVIDSTGESLSIEGANPNADEDIAAWFRNVPKRIAKRGPAVAVLDHMPKAGPDSLWPIGSQRKRAAIDGAQYLQEVLTPFSREKAGAAKLVCAKDRHGTYARGERVAVLHVTPEGDAVRIALTAPEGTAAAPAKFEPTGYMEKVSRALEEADGPVSYREIERRVTGKKEWTRKATEALIESGHIRTEPGSNRAILHILVKPFRECPPVSPSVPRGTPDPVSPVSPSLRDTGHGDTETGAPVGSVSGGHSRLEGMGA